MGGDFLYYDYCDVVVLSFLVLLCCMLPLDQPRRDNVVCPAVIIHAFMRYAAIELG